MNGFDLYNFLLCLVTFIMVGGLFAVLIGYLTKQSIRLVRLGAEDDEIKEEYFAKQEKTDRFRWVNRTFSAVLFIVMLAVFGLAVYVNVCENTHFDNIPTVHVVGSNSMSKIHRQNTYLTENGLTGQFSRFDLIFTEKIPPQEELKLYDIVIYDYDGIPIVHRIVKIEEPNDGLSGDRLFTLQGDNEPYPDKYPVYYDQMEAIYTGKHIKYIGSLVFFFQSIAGWLCILLIVFSMVITPMIEKKIENEKRERLIVCGVIPDENTNEPTDP